MSDTAQPPTRAVPPLVMVVDDYADSRELYGFHLTRVGYRVEEIGDGHTAFAKATQLVPDVVLTDMMLPGIDGWELVRRLKGDARTAHVPVIALTAAVVPGDEARAWAVGCDGFLRTPISPEVLAAEVARVLECMAREREQASQ